MCTCHRINKETGKVERVKGIFPLSTGNKGDVFRFPHEDFTRTIIEIHYVSCDCFAPPTLNYSGLDERGQHTFHTSFKAFFGELN